MPDTGAIGTPSLGLGQRKAILPEAEPMIIQDIRDALVVRGADTFLLPDRSGNVPPGDQRGFGLYHHDTRYLSTCSLSFGRANPVVLLSTAEMGFSQEQVLTNPSMEGLD